MFQLDNKIKRAHLEKNMLFSFVIGKNIFVAYCDSCNKKLSGSIRISKNNIPYSVKVKGAEFHHMDGNPENDVVENMRLYCHKCHRIVHLWGIIQRWLEKTGKTVEDLPDARKLKPMLYKRY